MKKVILAGLMAFFALPIVVLAQNHDQIFIQSTSNDTDSYATGLGIRITEEITGDLYAAGQDLSIEAKIGQDLGVAGMIIRVQAEVGDDIRAAGQLITITQKVGDSITAVGQRITLREGAEVGGDVWASGESIELNAPIHGNVKLSGSRIKINSIIDGNAEITGGEISFGPDGFITGNLKLRAAKKVPEDKYGGEFDYIERMIDVDWKSEEPFYQQTIREMWSFTSLLFLLSTLSIGGGLLFVAQNYFRSYAVNVRTSPFIGLGIGLLMLIGMPALAIIMTLTVIGLPIGGIILLLFLAILILADIMAGLAVGCFLYPVNQKSTYWNLFGSFALGTFIIFLLALIPLFGAVLKFLILLTAFGSIGREHFYIGQFLNKEKKI